jgi:hypothetical protein
MNIERLKSDVALRVVAKTGITTEQASVILDNVIKLPSADTEKTLNVSELEVRLINRKVSGQPHVGRIKIFDCPYETVAKFNVGRDLHEITFFGLDRALSDPAGQVEVVEEQGGRLIVIGGLDEGDLSDKWSDFRTRDLAFEGDLEGDPVIGRKRRKKG